MRYILGFIFLLISKDVLANQCCHHPCSSWWKQGWAATLYSGPLTSQTSSRIVREPDFGNSGIVAFAISKKLRSFWKERLAFELESQAVQHFGKQKHFEFNPIALVARWTSFPWNNTLPTTLAIGDGISIATRTPKLEVKRRGKRNAARTLNYLMAEATFSAPALPQWAFVLRYHHRSGAFGTFHGVEDASTVFAAGIKRWF